MPPIQPSRAFSLQLQFQRVLEAPLPSKYYSGDENNDNPILIPDSTKWQIRQYLGAHFWPEKPVYIDRCTVSIVLWFPLNVYAHIYMHINILELDVLYIDLITAKYRCIYNYCCSPMRLLLLVIISRDIYT